jgi:ATP-dependent helicase/nuclease subunit B
MKAEFLSRKGPRWYTIPADRPFLDDLAEGLLALTEGEGPEALSDAVVLTPTRRAARSLTEAFLRRANTAGALLPPRIRPLGDLEAGEARRMEQAEARAMHRLRLPNPWGPGRGRAA